MDTKTENLNEAPKKQIATSLFHQLWASLPVSALLAILFSSLCYWSRLGLPLDVAKELSLEIRLAFLGGGTLSTGAAAVGFAQRALKVTQAKINNNTKGGSDE